jgi:hypothetical protein
LFIAALDREPNLCSSDGWTPEARSTEMTLDIAWTTSIVSTLVLAIVSYSYVELARLSAAARQ